MEEILLKMVEKNLTKIKFIKDLIDLNKKGEEVVKKRKGDVIDASEENAQKFVELGYAIYKNNKIFANINAVNYKALEKKYPSVNISNLIERKVKYFKEHPFKDKTKKVWIEQIKDFLEFVNEDWKEETKEIKKETKATELGKAITFFTNKKNLAEQFVEIQPLYYDKSKMWWIWNKKEFFWEIIDETDIMNEISNNSEADTITSKERTEILEALKQVSRAKSPKPIKKTWIQFKDLIVDIETGEEFKATSEYFVTNPIPWKLNKERFIETPTMNKIFEEWVGKNYIKTLYEILSYALLPSYPIHRIFCFIGEGMNGKSKFLELLRKFIGNSNCCSTELDTLLSSRFEVTRLHKKLVCQMGETNFNEMSKTSLLKKLSGGDLIGFEYKNKNPFEELNYAKILIATNNLPTTTDKTIGFYRRWMIVDFPNRFSEQKDILSEIPDEEFECLAVKSLGIIKDLLDKRKFHKEGSIEEREKKYEEHSDPLEKFMKEFVVEDLSEKIWKFEFEKKLNGWCKENRFRQMSEIVIGKRMKDKGIEQAQRMSDWFIEGQKKPLRAWVGIKWRSEKKSNSQGSQE